MIENKKENTPSHGMSKDRRTLTILERISTTLAFVACFLYVVYIIGFIWVAVTAGVRDKSWEDFSTSMYAFTWTINILFIVSNLSIAGLAIAQLVFVGKLNKKEQAHETACFFVWIITVVVMLIFIATGIFFAAMASKGDGKAYLPLLMFLPTTACDTIYAVYTLRRLTKRI